MTLSRHAALTLFLLWCRRANFAGTVEAATYALGGHSTPASFFGNCFGSTG